MPQGIGRLVVATRNTGKLAEIRHALDGLVGEVVGLDDMSEAPEVVEDGETFGQNAAKKANEVAQAVGGWVLADDSGLEVDSLGGAPGVYSARYADEEDRAALGLAADAAQDEANNTKLLDALNGLEGSDRGARFRAVLALVGPDEALQFFDGACEGVILHVPQGRRGFGYDPLFMPVGRDRSMAELTMEEKNGISHRGRALAALKEYLASR